MEGLGIRQSDASAYTPNAVHSSSCLNCGATLHGVFCAECGQRDIPPYPSVRELVVDAFWELSGWDGRFASTVRGLLRRPGSLTRDFLEGRRARHLSPLRLYLMASLAYFLVAAAAPDVSRDGKTIFIGVTVGNKRENVLAPSRPERVATETRQALASKKALSDSAKKAALADIAKAPKLMQPLMRKAIEDPSGFRRGLLEAMPRMLFALLPVFALIVAMFYRGKKYPEHFYFAIHLHAFIFLALAVAAATRFTQVAAISGTAELLALVWICVYATIAFRRVYGGSMLATLTKEAVIGVIYSVLSFAALIVTIYVVSLGA